MHIPAEASGQALSPQDQVALMTEAIQQDVILLIFHISTVVHKDHHVSLQQIQDGNLLDCCHETHRCQIPPGKAVAGPEVEDVTLNRCARSF
ncbi:hypothetical protein P7K49_030342 [Saguinus oedipus]|uniref:Uncharacterized protein n=1 Tax=Saguinus oedipus TaxID=9490 RepID=A0ABQ9U325_SAGOE|nr:hypothetical protein P7K49_030342 [Saguinus oedipus]